MPRLAVFVFVCAVAACTAMVPIRRRLSHRAHAGRVGARQPKQAASYDLSAESRKGNGRGIAQLFRAMQDIELNGLPSARLSSERKSNGRGIAQLFSAMQDFEANGLPSAAHLSSERKSNGRGIAQLFSAIQDIEVNGLPSVRLSSERKSNGRGIAQLLSAMQDIEAHGLPSLPSLPPAPRMIPGLF
ncbi:hypothetical protein T492DRAFT_1087266 [Pavlovales sp. CCMP2436]|nr:hypothetical protein T492DRAFT_1087266 [Pavlovales sp. CCMP2436]